MKRVLLIYPPYEGRFYLKSRSPFPLGLLYIAAYLRNKGIDAAVKDFGYPPDKLKAEKPSGIKSTPGGYFRHGASDAAIRQWLNANLDSYHSVIGISSMMSTAYSGAYKIATMIKSIDKSRTIVLGGPHATAFPEHVAKHCPAVDYIAIGEGGQSFHSFLSGSAEGIYHANDISSTCRAFITSLDGLPFPERGLLMDDRTIEEMPITFSRGCPHTCSFCGSHLIQGRTWRHKSVERAVEELAFYEKEWGTRSFIIEDDNLCPGKGGQSWLAELCRRVVDKKYRFRVPHGLPVYATADPELCELLWQAGFRQMVFPLESTNPGTLSDMKKEFTPDNWRKAIQSWRFEKHHPTEIILGYPFVETIETMLRTMIDISKEKARIWASYYRPNRGTDLFDRCVRAGYIKGEFDPIVMNDVSIATERFTADDIKGLIRISRGINFGTENDVDVFRPSSPIEFSGYRFIPHEHIRIGDVVAEGKFAFSRGQDIFTELLVARMYGKNEKPHIETSKDNRAMIYYGTRPSKIYAVMHKIFA